MAHAVCMSTKGPRPLKIRRWSYEITVTKDGNTRMFEPPALTVGARPAAEAAAEQLRQNVLKAPGFENATVSVKPVSSKHKVDERTLRHLNGLNDELQIIGIALKNVCTELAKTEMNEGYTDEDLATKATELIGEYCKAAQKELIERRTGGKIVDPEELPEGQPAAEMAETMADVAQETAQEALADMPVLSE